VIHTQQNLIALLCQYLLFQFDANCRFQKLKQSREYSAHLEMKMRERSMAGARFDLFKVDWKERGKLLREVCEADELKRCKEGSSSNYHETWPETCEEFIDLVRCLMSENVLLRTSLGCCQGDISSLLCKRDLLQREVLQLQRENPHLQSMLTQEHDIQGERRLSSEDSGNLQLSCQSMPMETCKVVHSSSCRSTEIRSTEQATTSTYYRICHSMSSSHVSSRELDGINQSDCDDHRTRSLKPAT
jgi:hypothetical protein